MKSFTNTVVAIAGRLLAHTVMQLASPAMLFFRPQRYSYFQTLHPPRSTEA
jgi:hypothetical protein